MCYGRESATFQTLRASGRSWKAGSQPDSFVLKKRRRRKEKREKRKFKNLIHSIVLSGYTSNEPPESAVMKMVPLVTAVNGTYPVINLAKEHTVAR